MPTLAHRVWPSTVTSASSPASASWRSSSARMAERNAAVLSPSSPISAAALYTNASSVAQRPDRAASRRADRSRAASTRRRTAGSPRSRPCRRTRRWRPAESRPRTSSRSSADNATCTEWYASSAAIDGSGPASAPTARGPSATGRGRRPTAASLARTSAALTASSSLGAAWRPTPPSSSASSASSTGREPLDPVTDHERGLRIAEQRPDPGHAPELAVDRLHRGRGRTQPLVQRGARNHRARSSRGCELPHEPRRVGHGARSRGAARPRRCRT